MQYMQVKIDVSGDGELPPVWDDLVQRRMFNDSQTIEVEEFTDAYMFECPFLYGAMCGEFFDDRLSDPLTLVEAAKAVNACTTGTSFDFRDDIDAAIDLINACSGPCDVVCVIPPGWLSV